MNTPIEPGPAAAYEPVILVRLRGPEGLALLLDVRATALWVTAGGGDTLEFVLDDLPGDPGPIAARLGVEPWCAEAQVYPAVAVGAREPVSNGVIGLLQKAVRTVNVRDPALGPLRYLLLPNDGSPG